MPPTLMMLALTVLAPMVLTFSACSSGGESPVITADASGSTAADGNGQSDGVGADAAIQTIDELCWWEDCSADTWCVAGTPTACTPVTCDVPTPAKDETAWQITKLTFLPKNVGCDLNQDAVADNALAALNVLVGLDEQAANAILSGRYTNLLRPVTDAKGTLSGLDVLTGMIDETALAAGCIPAGEDTTKRCPLRLRKESYDLTGAGVCRLKASCAAKSSGGDGVEVTCAKPVPQPVIASPQVRLPGYDMRMSGTLPLQDDERQLGLHTAVAKLRVCGMLKWSDVDKRLDLLPAQVLKKYRTNANALKKALGEQVKPDMDTNGDGVADSVSFAVDVELREVKIVGKAQ